MDKLIERFLKYVSFETTSDEETGVTPSTPGQMVLAKYLKEELENLGLIEVFLDDNGYLYADGGGNYLSTQTNLTDKGKWRITLNNGVTTIVSNGGVTQNTIKFNLNNGNPIFSCYASGQLEVCLFRRTEISD